MRLRFNLISGTIQDNPLTSTQTFFTSSGLTYLPTITAPDYAVVTLNPLANFSSSPTPEIVYITAHTAASNTATILRACEGTSPQQFSAGTAWEIGPTNKDFVDENLVLNGKFLDINYTDSTKAWGWTYPWGTPSNGSANLSTTVIPNGVRSLSITTTAPNGTYATASSMFSTIPGDIVQVSGYVAGYSGSSGTATIQLLEFTTSTGTVPATTTTHNVTVSSNSFIPFNFAVTVEHPYALVVLSNSGSANAGTLYFGDIAALKVQPAPFYAGNGIQINNNTVGLLGADNVNIVASSGLTYQLPDPSSFIGNDITLSGSCQFLLPSASSAYTTGGGKALYVRVRQPASGGPYTPTWSYAAGSIFWPGGSIPIVSQIANAIDVFEFISDGTNWYGLTVGQNFK